MSRSCDGKTVAFHRHRARVILRRAYKSDPSRAEIEAFQSHKLCIRDPEIRESLADLRHRLKAKWEASIALTPYPGPNGTRWAIPWSIVACESGGSWSAANPSGAIGPYQLLGHGAPWPVTSESDKMAHHRIASALWAGGAGRSAWVC